MMLGELAQRGHGVLHGEASVCVTGVRHDSRAVEPGDLFVAIRGATADGAAHVPAAIARGAVAVLSNRLLPHDVAQLVTAEPRRVLGRIAEAVYGEPTARLVTIGVTGTNGKTTTAFLIRAALEASGKAVALLGTVGSFTPTGARSATFTTPEGDDLARFSREALDAGATHLVMEVSSHALALHRVDGVRFQVAAFTNLTQDHLDFHGSMDAYGAAKARLFLELAAGVAVINVDDPFGEQLASRVAGNCLRCSVSGQATAEVRVLTASFTAKGIVAQVATPWGPIDLTSPLLGAHNLENLLVAATVSLAAGCEPAAVTRGLASARGAPGRLERVDDPRGSAVVVDYAHTPDALERALRALRPLTRGRLIVVFGCGGDRDRGKRPLMGAAAATLADVCVVTSDNPRTESPSAIIEEIMVAVRSGALPPLREDELGTAPRGHLAVEDRAAAIEAAVAAARADDTVLVAGKGHEDYQIVGTERRPFDDRIVAERAIRLALRS